ncbi:MAG: hypothetical protein WDW36_002163 [Sanguina aurantia]
MSENKLDFVPRVSLLPLEWRSLGGVLGQAAGLQQDLTSRFSLALRQGFDPAARTATGRVIEACGDAGVSLQYRGLALALSMGGLSFKSGLDDPLLMNATPTYTSEAVPSLKATMAMRLAADRYLAVSYDLKQRKPEIAAAWSGETYTEKATLLLSAPPGPDWRVDVYDDDADVVEEPKDDGGRHTLYVQHSARPRDLLYRTRLGARLDLGRVANLVSDYVGYNVEDSIPMLFWNIPGMQQLFRVLVPDEDENQVRHHIKGWEVDVAHEFTRGKPAVSLIKTMQRASVSASYNFAESEASLDYSRRGIRVSAKMANVRGVGWKKPSLNFYLEPLSLL